MSKSVPTPSLPKSRRYATKAFFWFRVLVTVGVLGYLVSVFDWTEAARVLRVLRWEYAWLGPTSLLIGFVFASLRWKYLLSDLGVLIRWRSGFALYLVGSFYGSFLPGVIGGDAVRIGMCALRHEASVSEVTTSALIERVLGLLVVLLFGSFAIPFLPRLVASELGPSISTLLPILAVTVTVLVVTGVFLLRAFPIAWFERRSFRFHRLVRVIERARDIRVRTLLFAIVLSGLFQLSSIIASFLIARALHIDLPFIVFLAVMPLVYVVTVLPISLGGLGVREGTLSFLLTRIGVTLPDAILFAFAMYLNQLFVGLVGGVIQFVGKKRFYITTQTAIHE